MSDKETPAKDYTQIWRVGVFMISLGAMSVALGAILAGVASTYHNNTENIVESVGLIVFGVIFVIAGANYTNKASALRSNEERIAEMHQRQLEIIDAQKAARSRKDAAHELEVLSKQLAHELTMEVEREVRRSNQRDHDKWAMLVRRVDSTMQGLILAKTELRDNPLGEEIVKQFKTIYDLTKEIDKDQKIDPIDFGDRLEQVLLMDFAKRRGINVDKII